MSIRPINSVLQKVAEKELNEDVRRTPSDIEAVKQWLSKQPHLSSVKPSDQWILAFLRGCKFSLERTKEKIDMYYTLRTVVPEFFSDRDPRSQTIQDILKSGINLPLLKTATPSSARPYLIRLGLCDPSKFSLQDLLKVSFMITEIMMLEDDNFTISGQEIVLDLKNVNFSLIGQFTPGLAKKVTTCTERACPVRQHAYHMLNTMPGFEAVYAMFRGFLSDKIKKRVNVHNTDFEALFKLVPKTVMPAEYGGEGDSIPALIEHWQKKVESYRDWFLQEDIQKSDESRRSGTPKTSESLFGTQGSFRQLDVD